MDEFSDISIRLPDLGAVLANRIASKKALESGDSLPPAGTVDPYQLMLQRKRGEETTPPIEVKDPWPPETMKPLQDYCARMGIVGFNCGRMHPIAALAFLKQKLGGDFTNVPLENRVEDGYEKLGEHSGNGPNYPFTQASLKRQILHG